MGESIERLSTGKRINSPSDDPAGYVAATETRSEITELEANLKALRLERGEERIAGAGQDAILNALHFLRGEVITAASDTTTPEQRAQIQQGIDTVIEAIDQVRARQPGSTLGVELDALRSGKSANVVSGDVAEAARIVDGSVASLTQARGQIAANERNKFGVFEELYEDMIVTHTETLSIIEDADFAVETASFMQSRILQKASYASLAFEREQRAAIAEKLIAGLTENA